MANNGTRERIIKAAFRRFYDFGYNGTSVQDIVDAVGIPKGNFYNYFKSKELLAIEALKQYACIADQVFVHPSNSEAHVKPSRKSNLAQLRDKFVQAATYQQELKLSRGCLMGNFVAESADLPESFQAIIQESFARWQGVIKAWLSAAQAAGEIPKTNDLERLSRFIFSSWEGALLLAKGAGGRAPIDDFLHYTFDILLKMPRQQAKKSAAVSSKLSRTKS
jgi:TetR/AcrR family transcriptional repressor of nem operon